MPARVELVPWDDVADQAMCHPAGRDCVPFLRAEVQRGRSRLWRCTDGCKPDGTPNVIAHLVTRFDRNPDELVIAYCEGRDVPKFAAEFLEAARTRGVPLRIHTTQPAVARYLRRFGLQLQEYVLRTVL